MKITEALRLIRKTRFDSRTTCACQKKFHLSNARFSNHSRTKRHSHINKIWQRRRLPNVYVTEECYKQARQYDIYEFID